MSELRDHAALTTAPDVARIVDRVLEDEPPSLINASLLSARLIAETMTGVIQPQIDAHGAAITAAQAQIGTHGETIAGMKAEVDAHGAAITQAQAQIGTHGEAIASVKTEVDAHGEAITGTQAKLGGLAVTTARHEEAIALTLLGESGHIGRLHEAVAELGHRVARLEPHDGHGPHPDHAAAEQAREYREANEALRERIEAMEGAIRQLLERGPPRGGGARPPRQR